MADKAKYELAADVALLESICLRMNQKQKIKYGKAIMAIVDKTVELNESLGDSTAKELFADLCVKYGVNQNG